MKSRRFRLGSALLAAGVGAGASEAGWASCNVSATAVNFGIYNPLSGTPNDAMGTVTVSCVVLLGLFDNWTISLGTGNSGSYSPRLLGTGSSFLSYNLYTSASHSTVWGDGSGTTGTVSDGVLLVIGGNTNMYTVYGRIPARQDAAAGTYMDTIVVTLNY